MSDVENKKIVFLQVRKLFKISIPTLWTLLLVEAEL